MMSVFRTFVLGLSLAHAGALVYASGAHATALQASPVLIEMTDKSPSATITIRNTGDKPIDVQTRVMRWTQEAGKESLDEAEDVVASPPMTTLRPGANYAVRVVRTAKSGLSGEEAYRVLVDQLPDANGTRGTVVALVMRHSIPVFLSDGQGGAPKVSWQVGARNGRMVLRATNTGTRRLRLAQVSVKLNDGRKISFGNGLLGYVLAGSSMEWVSPTPVGNVSGGTISATTDLGPLNAPVHAAR
jgi:fimbrial chaperone protein